MFAVRNTDDIKLLCLTALFGKKAYFPLQFMILRNARDKREK